MSMAGLAQQSTRTHYFCARDCVENLWTRFGFFAFLFRERAEEYSVEANHSSQHGSGLFRGEFLAKHSLIGSCELGNCFFAKVHPCTLCTFLPTKEMVLGVLRKRLCWRVK
jgi:hypothetical protein